MPTRKRRRAEETALSKAVQEALTAKGCKVIRVQSGILPVLKGGKTHFVHCAPTGTPDLVVLRLATTTWLEVKNKTGKPTEEQAEWAEWARLNGVRYACVRSISEAVDATFRK